MNKKEISVLWRLAKINWVIGTSFWIIETVVFWIYEGWHYHATNPIEIYCDKIVGNFWQFALYLTVFSSFYLLVNLSKTKK